MQVFALFGGVAVENYTGLERAASQKEGLLELLAEMKFRFEVLSLLPWWTETLIREFSIGVGNMKSIQTEQSAGCASSRGDFAT